MPRPISCIANQLIRRPWDRRRKCCSQKKKATTPSRCENAFHSPGNRTLIHKLNQTRCSRPPPQTRRSCPSHTNWRINLSERRTREPGPFVSKGGGPGACGQAETASCAHWRICQPFQADLSGHQASSLLAETATVPACLACKKWAIAFYFYFNFYLIFIFIFIFIYIFIYI